MKPILYSSLIGMFGLATSVSYSQKDIHQNAWDFETEPTSSLVYVCKNTEKTEVQSMSDADRLRVVLDFFSLSPTEAKNVFKVSRQAIYDWKNNRNINTDNRERLDTLYAIANQWFSKIPGGLDAHLRAKFTDDNSSILDYLKRDTFDADFVNSRIELILSHSKDPLLKNHNRLRWHKEIASLGYEQKSFEEQQENLRDNMQRLRLKS